jgi:hypothetical protein
LSYVGEIYEFDISFDRFAIFIFERLCVPIRHSQRTLAVELSIFEIAHLYHPIREDDSEGSVWFVSLPEGDDYTG